MKSFDLASWARRASERGRNVEVQATVVHDHAAHFALAHALAALLACLAWWAFPFWSLIALVAVGVSSAAELVGRAGWLRSWVPRRTAHNLVLWPDRPPALAVLVETDATAPPTRWSLLLAWASLPCAFLGMTSAPLDGPFARDAMVVATWSALVAVIGTALHARDAGQPLRPEGADALFEAALRDPSAAVWVFAQGGACSHDGLRTFLLHHRHRLDLDQVPVVLVHPDAGAERAHATPGAVATELPKAVGAAGLACSAWSSADDPLDGLHLRAVWLQGSVAPERVTAVAQVLRQALTIETSPPPTSGPPAMGQAQSLSTSSA